MSSPSHLLVARVKRLMLGVPKRTDQQHNERLGIFAGLAVFSADAISSVAYATEEILLVLVTASVVASAYSLSVGLAIVGLVFIVAASYNQTIKAYPSGGGSYVVSKDNLGVKAGLTAGAALLVDYVLTVAVSTASGIAALTSAIPSLRGHEVALCILAIWFIAWVNLRGVKESGTIFAVPTYSFIAAVFLMIGVGAFKALTGTWHPAAPVAAGFGFGSEEFKNMTSGVTAFMLLRAFASGCTALSGIEAVSNGVMAFKAPEPETAIRTMKISRTILFTMFTGITLLAYGFQLVPHHGGETLLSQLGHQVFGSTPFYYVLQATTCLILLLAANTAYADFPRLTSMIARDGYLPRRLANLGDTLVFHYGIIALATLASVLTVIFRGDVHHLIPLYAVGVFLAFTMSQTGMVIHWLKVAKQPGESLGRHSGSLLLNGFGAILSGVALVVTTITKFVDGAWIVCLIVPAIIVYFQYVHDYYKRFRARVDSLLQEHMTMDDARKIKVVLTIGGLSPVIDHSMRVARRMSDDVTAVYVAVDPGIGEKVQRKWDINRHGGVPLTIIPSPYREVVEPLRKYLDKLQRENPDTLINLLMPVIVTNEPFDTYLHNGTADQLQRELRYSEGIVVTQIPFYVNMNPKSDRVIAHEPTAEGDD